MLGKTNINTIKEGTIVSDVEDYSWDAVTIEGIASDFVKVIHDSNTLVAITKEGTIVYSRDGETWEAVRLDLEEQYELNDIIWDGKRYVAVGSCIRVLSDGPESMREEAFYVGFVVATENLKDFNITFDQEKCFSRYLSIAVKNSQYIIVRASVSYYSTGSSYHIELRSFVGELDALKKKSSLYGEYYNVRENGLEYAKKFLERISVNIAKNSVVILLYVKIYDYKLGNGQPFFHGLTTTVDGDIYKIMSSKENTYSSDAISVFECKDNLYYCTNNAEWTYEFAKIIGTNEKAIIKTNINFSFVDSVYFNKCEIYINAHQMLIIKPGEKLADKTLEDLIDITYDFSMTNITKTLDKLYIFGTDGNVLVSSDEIKNEEALAVKTMSAHKALYDATAYTDKKYAELEARIKILENGL